MKARLPISNKLRNQIQSSVKAEYDKQGQDLARRYIKLMCVVLNKDFGFGKQRLIKFAEAFNKLSSERDDDEVFWYHIDDYLKSIDMIMPEEDYERLDK